MSGNRVAEERTVLEFFPFYFGLGLALVSSNTRSVEMMTCVKF